MALQASRTPDLPCLACAGNVQGGKAASVLLCRAELQHVCWVALASVAPPSASSLLPLSMAWAELYTAMTEGEEQLLHSGIVGHQN